MKRKFLQTIALISAVAFSAAADSFSLNECRGSRMPYEAPDSTVCMPDSLTPVMIYHVGRHGARYATSADRFLEVEARLSAREADLTPAGRKLLAITREAIDLSADRWGHLDSLGIAEQQGIARRLCLAWPQLIVGQQVSAISSPVGRCIASMDAFVGVVRRMQSGLGNVTTSAGEQWSYLMRPFAVDSAYIAWKKAEPYAPELQRYTDAESPAPKLINSLINNSGYSPEQAREFGASVYYVVSSLAAMGFNPDGNPDGGMSLLTPEEYNAFWRIDNLRQYLQRTQTTLSTLPADIASPLLEDMIQSVDSFIAGTDRTALKLHFGHAETLMPLLSLMRLPGCYYLTHYFDTVSDHWQTFHVVPMAANLQVILLRSHSGRHYVRIDLNEHPVALHGHDVYTPWSRLKPLLQSLL